ncbi:MAG: TauD/TfdA family dioxygenase [Candidatus Binatia bacterium]|nr:TauD/TfdA family dioxygenase [Candidatus Binatia bacterium]
MTTDAAAWANYRTITIDPLSPTVGAEIGGVRMSGDVSSEQIGEIRRALLEWKVIFFRDQDVSIEEHIAFGRLFGELEIHPFATNLEGYPEVVVIHHDEKSRFGQNDWHSDVTWRLEPSLGSILRATIVPPVGGDTLFCDMNAAYDGLADDIKEKIDGMTAVHSYTRLFGGRLPEKERAEMREKYPDARHPVVRTHPETGAKSLYVNSSFVSHLDGVDEVEGCRLLRLLYRQSAIPEFQCRFRWRKNSVSFWDNRAVQHYAAFDYKPNVRHVERVTIVGDKPV